MRPYLLFAAGVLLASPCISSAAPLPLPENVSVAKATPAQIKAAVKKAATGGVDELRGTVAPTFSALECSEIKKAAAYIEAYLAAAAEDCEWLVRKSAATKPCLASLIAATASGILPDQKAEIAAAAKAGVRDHLAASGLQGGGKEPVGGKAVAGDDPVEALLKDHPELAGATSRSIDLAVAAGVRNGPLGGWIDDVPFTGPSFVVSTGLTPPRKPADDTTGGRRPARPPQSGTVSPDF